MLDARISSPENQKFHFNAVSSEKNLLNGNSFCFFSNFTQKVRYKRYMYAVDKLMTMKQLPEKLD